MRCCRRRAADDPERAAETYLLVLKEFPQATRTPKTMHRLASARHKLGRPKDAASYWMRLVREFPHDELVFDAEIASGEYFLTQGLFTPALLHYQRAFADGTSPPEHLRAHLARAMLTWATAGSSRRGGVQGVGKCRWSSHGSGLVGRLVGCSSAGK